MKIDRRGILKVFGIGAAATGTLSAKGDTEIEQLETREPVKALAGGFSGEWFDVIAGRLYSALEIDPLTSWGMMSNGDHEFFRDQLGSHPAWSPYRLNYSDTNMCMPSALEAPTMFCVNQIGMLFAPTCNQDHAERWLSHRAIELWVGNRQFFRSPLADMFTFGDEKAPLKGFVDLSPLPVVIQTQQTFHVRVTGLSYPMSRLRMWAVLQGFHARGVQ